MMASDAASDHRGDKAIHGCSTWVPLLADQGCQRAPRDRPHLRAGLNVCRGKVTCPEVASAQDYPCHDPLHALAA
jgi:alanine dehydrogenase